MKKPLLFQAFEWYLKEDGKFWKKLKDSIPMLANLGVTQIWLPPAFKGHQGQKDVGYGVYDLYDLGEFNQKGSVITKYGSKNEYLDLIQEIKDYGLELIVDVVLNHRMGADASEVLNASQVNPSNRFEVLDFREIEAWTKYEFKARNNKYSSFKWNHRHFKAVDYDLKRDESGIFLFEGKSWDSQVDDEMENYDFLMGADVDFNVPEVKEELFHWLKWYQERVGFDGVRLDAVKHIDARFFKESLQALREVNPKTFAVGEYWSGDLKVLHNYLMNVDFSMQLFDIPLHFAFYEASHSEHYDLRTLYKGTLVSNNPSYAVTFVDNHDTQKGQSLASWVNDWFKLHAYAFILLRDIGTPSVFYSDLFGSTQDTMNKVENLEKLLLLRKKHMVGTFYDYMDDESLIGWCYTGLEEVEGFVVVLNVSEAQEKRLFVGKHNANSHYQNILNPQQEVMVNENGIGDFLVDEKSTAIYVKKEGQYETGIL